MILVTPALGRREPEAVLGEPAEGSSRTRRLRAWVPSVVWAALIFIMSTDTMSEQHTRSLIEPVLRFIAPSLSPSGIQLAHEVIRKLAHFGEYFVFFLALEHGFRHGSAVSRATVPLRALAVAALYSLTDEGHQLYVASRGASLADCGLDTLGAAIAAVMRKVSSRLP